MLKDKLQSDLKAAMLSGDKERVEALKMLKAAITYKEVELGTRNEGLTDEQIIDVFSKEFKKRADAAQMYEQAGRVEQAAHEKFEQKIISEYLPEQASDEEIQAVVNESIAKIDNPSMQNMGQVIGIVKARFGQTADGAKIAAIVKEALAK